MSGDSLHAAYEKLDAAARHVMHICAFSQGAMSRRDIAEVSNRLGWTDRGEKRLTQAAVGQIVEKLTRQDLMERSSYNYVAANPAVEDLAVQDSIRQDWFGKLATAIKTRSLGFGLSSYSYERHARDLRIAFYGGDVSGFQSRVKSSKGENRVRLLDPFSRDIFDRLDPILQEMYLVGVVPRVILDPAEGKEILPLFDERAEAQASPSDEVAGCWLDLAVARGDFQSLARLDERTRHKLAEIEGCEALLHGDFERAEQRLAAALGGASSKGKRSRMATTHLPAVLYLLLLIKRGSAEALTQAQALIAAATKGKTHYSAAMQPITAALAFRQAPSSPAQFAKRLKELANSPLDGLLVGYFHRWLLTDDDAAMRGGNFAAIAGVYQAAGLAWVAAEAAGLAGQTGLKSAAAQADKQQKLHAQLGTTSLVNLIEPEPVWSRALDAIAQLAENRPAAAAVAAPAAADERLIWEFNTSYGSIHLQPFAQKRTAGGWTAGRRVGLQRLYDEWNKPEFAFLTEQDRALCRALCANTARNHYGYTETSYYFDEPRAARALVGHPCVFHDGDRDTPLEIVEQPPRLVVEKQGDTTIAIKIEPEPPKSYGDDNEGERTYRLTKDGPRRIVLVFFSEQHLKMHKILGKKLEVPAAAAKQVLASIQKISALVAVHSELGGELPAAESMAGDSRPHVHLLPFQGGLRAEFFVRPFGDDGLFCRPGHGGANVFASLGGQPKTARRDLAEEQQRLQALLAACPALAGQAEGDAAAFPSPVEALEALLQLEDEVAEKRVVLHWPHGQSLRLAGRASPSQFHMNIRRDHDWFAASGSLKVDRSLSVDMMQLIELVEASPSRFVQLEDGRFLALTEQLRQRIEELAAYGDRREKSLRFPPVRAAALEDLGESVKLKADAAWTEWVQRMRKAGDVRPVAPTTLQAELRDYQRDGFQWLARLAAWGVGGCLADDMGLGKTIEALALLLHRAAGGPALVVAPTSVAFNWINETNRFAPTLNARLFGPGDRDAFFRDLGPRDVVISSYGLLHGEAARFQSQSWHTVILDEAQAIKNTATRRSQAAMGLSADFRLIMTGTPLENHLGELWNLFQFINPGLLGSLEHFQQQFAAPIERDGSHETRRRLKKLIQPFLLRRTKTQVLAELPPRIEVTLQVELSDEEAAFYEALRRRALEKLAEPGDGRSQHLKILAEIMRLRRACCHPNLVLADAGISSSKLALFSETIDELQDNHHKALVFSQFVDHLTILREELDRKGVSYQYLDGSTPAGQRKKRVEAFQSGEGDVFLISLKAGGLGLNLTAADYVLHMDPWWNPAVEDQASDRAHRLGQKRPVTIYRFITQGTIEERITHLHAKKRDLADSLLEGADLSGKLSAEELLKLIRE